MFSNLVICCGVALCAFSLVATQFPIRKRTLWQSPANASANQSSSSAAAPESLNAGTWNTPQQQQQHGGNTSSAVEWVNHAPVTQFFGQLARGEVIGLRKCKKPKDCGLGLRCDLLLNLCVPFNTPILSDIEKPCMNDSECSGLHSCQAGLCRFCGAKSCRSSLDCCAGSFAQPGQHGTFYECLDIKADDKLSLARQLGRVPPNFQPIPKAAGGNSNAYEVDSAELIQLGLAKPDSAFYGKRCWARCHVDSDCHHANTPADIRQAIGCCNNVCKRKSSCAVLSPLVIQQAHQLQQQRLQQQQVFHQQQLLLQQQQLQQQQQQQLLLQQQRLLLAGQVHQAAAAPQQQSTWGAGGGQIQQQPQYPQTAAAVQAQPSQVQYFAVPVQVVQTSRPVPQSWQEAQQAGSTPQHQYGPPAAASQQGTARRFQ